MNSTILKVISYTKNNPKKSIVGFILIIIILYFLFGRGEKIKYDTIPVTRGDIKETVLATGKIQPEKTITVSSRASGEIKKFFVEVDDHVKEGDTIAIVDPRETKNALVAAQSNLKATQANVQARKSELLSAQQEYTRQKIMLKAGATSKQLYQNALNSLNVAKANLKFYEEALVQSQKDLETKNLNLSYTTIKAPSEGTILSLLAEAGQTLNASFNIQPIVKLANLEKLIIKSEIPESDINKLKVNQEVEFSIIGQDNIVNKTKIKSIDAAPTTVSDPTAVATDAIYYYITMDAPNKENRLRMGMNVNVKILIATIKNALTIPNSALTVTDNNNEVLVYDPHKNKYVTRTVEVGISDGVVTEIKNGLTVDDIVVTQEVIKSKSKANDEQNAKNRKIIRYRN